MKIAIIVISILVIAALVVGGCAHRFKTPEKRAEYFTQKITKKLDLTGEQQVRLESLKEEMLALRKEISEKREGTRGSVRELLNVERFDQEKALDLVNGHVDEVQAKAPQIIAALGHFWDSLDARQQSQVREKMEKHFDRRSHWGH